MNVDARLTSAALNWVLDRNGIAPLGAMPLRVLSSCWKSTRLRSSDLGKAIQVLMQQGRVTLQERHDGLWLQCRLPGVEADHCYDPVCDKLRQMMVRRSLEPVALRQGYAGTDRRRSHLAGPAGRPAG